MSLVLRWITSPNAGPCKPRRCARDRKPQLVRVYSRDITAALDLLWLVQGSATLRKDLQWTVYASRWVRLRCWLGAELHDLRRMFWGLVYSPFVKL